MILYGTSKSRAARCLVMLEELGAAYEQVPLFGAGRDRAADRRQLDALNPNHHIPVLDDDGLIVWESMAINLYLADRHGGSLWPETAAGRGLAYQWSLWAQTEVDRADWNQARRARDPDQVDLDRRALVHALGVLDRVLQDRDYLLGQTFTVADVNVAVTLSEPHEQGLIGWQRLDPAAEGLAALSHWLERCRSRPSYARVLDRP